MSSEQKPYQVKLLSKELVTKDVMVLRFSKPDNFNYFAGQFVDFKVPHEGSFVARPYSISSIPNDEYLQFCAKILDKGKASAYFSKLNVGDLVELSKPQGVFTCAHNLNTDLVFVATGVGIAPIIAIIRNVLESGLINKVKLIFGVRYKEDVFWQQILKELKQKYSNFTYVTTVSRAEADWHGGKGRVTEHLQDLDRTANYFICGNLPMVKDVRHLLAEIGIDFGQIHFEIF